MTDLSKEQIARLRGLNAVYQALNAVQLSAFSLPLLLQIVLETGAKLTGAKYGALGIFDESGAKLADFLTIGLDEETKKRIGSQPMGLGLLGVMSDEPGAIRLRDLTRHPKSVGFPPHHPPMKSFLGISIRAHGRLFGRLYLTEKQGAEEFSEIDAELVTALASQAGIILERELLIEQLKAAEARHRLILESAAEGIYGLDLEGICTFINKAGAAMLGYRPEELVGRRMHSLVHHTRPDGSPYPEEECSTERSRRHGRPAHLIEDSYWRKDGTTFPVQLSCAPLVSDGALRGAVVTFFDITARKEAERRNALDHGIARAVIESATVDEANRKILHTVCEVLGWEWSAVWQVDQQANVLRCMTAWHRPELSVPEFETATCRMTFAPGVGLPGRVWSHGVPEYIPDVARDPNFPRAAVATRSGLRSGFAFPIRLGGDIVGVMEFFSRESREPSRDVLDLLNTLGGQIGLQIERKEAASRLMESENQLRTIIDTNPECVKILDETGALVTMNPHGLALVEADSLEEVIGKPVVSLVAPEYRDAFEQVNRRACRGESGTLEFELIGLKGTRRWLDTHVVPFRTTPDKAAMALSVTRDITARKRAEEALRESERTYATLLSNLPGMVYRCNNDRDWTLTFASEGALPLTGYAPSEFTQHRIHYGQLIHPEDQNAVWNNVQAALQARCPYELTYRIRTAAGEERWVWEQGRGVFSPNGDLLFLEGFVTDITARKLAETEQAQLSRILEASLNEIYVFDAGTLRFLHANSGALRNLGYTLDAIRTMTPLDLKPEFTEASFRQMIVPLLQRQQDVIVFQTVHRRANGSLYPVEVHLQLIDSEGNRVFLAIINDITERKQAEDRRRESELRFQQVTENIKEVFWMSDIAKSEIHYVSRAFEEIWGRTCDSLYAAPRSWLDAIHPDDRARVLEAATTKQVAGLYDETYRVVRPDGAIRWIRDRAFPVTNEDGQVYRLVGLAEDITEHRQAEEALRQAHGRLQTAQEEERKRIAREIHDELGQQLTMLRFGLVKLAQAEPQPPAYLRTQASALTQPVDAMIETVRRIATTLRPAILDDLGLAAALEWLVTDFRAKTHIPCDVSLTPVPEGLDDTRSLALFRILQEALTNVARHAQAARVSVRLERSNDTLVLEVRDNGRGLTETQRVSPTAVGLFGMQERALGVGGTVTIQSRPNEGTTVTARIPLRNRQ